MTSMSSLGTSRSKNLKLYGGLFVLGLLITVGAIMLGRSDTGVIDVTAAISRSNEERREAGDTSAPVNPVPSVYSTMPNGGLVPSDAPPQVTLPPEPAVESASTTEEEQSEDTADETDAPDTPADSDELDEGETAPLEEPLPISEETNAIE